MTNKLLLFLTFTLLTASSVFAQCTSSQSFSSIAAAEINGNMCATETFTVGTGGVSANTVVITDTSNPAKAIAGTGTGAYGVALSTVAAAGSVQVQRYGQVLCVLDNAGTAGDLVIPGTTTAIDCRDSGQTASSAISISTRVIGVLLQSATAGTAALVSLTPAHYGTLVSAGSSVFAASLGQTSVISQTGSPVTIYSVANVPALAAGTCYRINYATNMVTDGSTEQLWIDSTAVATLQVWGGALAWAPTDIMFCNTAGSQTTQTISFVSSGYDLTNVSGSYSPYTSVPPIPTVTSVNMATTHTFKITGNASGGTTQGQGFRIGQ